MTVLSAQSIKKLCVEHEMLSPFADQTRHEGVTFGLSASGYDVRIEFDSDQLKIEHVLSPGEFLLASTVERFRMPSHVVGIVHDKSTWARQGITVQNTVIEPGWEGWLTLEIINHGVKPVLLKRGVGIAQILFHNLDETTSTPYSGKYQNQKRGPIAAKNDN